jgi:hypothetical protein
MFFAAFTRALAFAAVAFVVLSFALHAHWWAPVEFTVAAVSFAALSVVLKPAPAQPDDMPKPQDAKPEGWQ